MKTLSPYLLEAKRRDIAYEIMELGADIDPYECKQNLFEMALDAYLDLAKGDYKSVIKRLNDALEDETGSIADDIADLIDEIYETEKEA